MRGQHIIAFILLLAAVVALGLGAAGVPAKVVWHDLGLAFAAAAGAALVWQ